MIAPDLSLDELDFLRTLASVDAMDVHSRSNAVAAAGLSAKGLAHWLERRTPGSTIRGHASITAAGLAAINGAAQ